MSGYPIGVLASGSGSNFEAVHDAIIGGSLAAEIKVLICNRPAAAVIDKAQGRHVPTRIIEHGTFANRMSFDSAVAATLADNGVELVVLAGFDRLVTETLLSRFPNRVLNIHPALLPAFTGTNAQTQAADYGVRIAGATVHLVDDKVDHGPIVAQVAVPAFPGEPAERLQRRILTQEHVLYPLAIGLFAAGRVRVSGRIVEISGEAEATNPLSDRTLFSPSIVGRIADDD